MAIPELCTARLILRAPIPDDAAQIFSRYAQDPEVTRYLIWSPHKSVSETEEFIERCIAESAGGVRFPWVITGKSTRELIGMIELQIHAGDANVGYVIARSEWGRGYVTEALRGVLDFAFSRPDVKRVWAVCDVANIASARVMEKAGMLREALVPSFIRHPNISEALRDVYRYAVNR